MNMKEFENSVAEKVSKGHYKEYKYLLQIIDVKLWQRYVDTLAEGYNMPAAFDHICAAIKLPEKNYARYLKYLEKELKPDKFNKTMEITGHIFDVIKAENKAKEITGIEDLIDKIKKEMKLGRYAARAAFIVLHNMGLISFSDEQKTHIVLTAAGKKTHGLS